MFLQYDSALDEYTEVIFDEFSDSSGEEIITHKERAASDPVLILKKKSLSKSRSAFIKLFNPARVIRKSGRLNIFLTKLPRRNISYISDLGYTLLSIKWRWILLTLVLVNFGCFLVFSVLWWLTALNSGDFRANHTGVNVCTVNARTFTGYMLLSLETVTTIGYGYRYPTEHCQGGWIMLMLQSLFNIFIQGVLVSTVYVKVTKPFTYRISSLFSKQAVICLRDGKLRFIFRINDFHRKIQCGTNISLYFVDKELCSDSGYEIIQMKIEPHGLLIFPLEIEHIIDEESPLWSFRPLDILQTQYELIAVAEGSSIITGKVSQNRTSYSNSDTLWGHRFKPCVDYDETKGAFVVDHKKFKQTVVFDTPLCSAKKLADIKRRMSQVELINNSTFVREK